MKKNVIISICAVVVVAAIALALIFVFGGQEQTPKTEKPDLSGTWVVVATYNNDTPVFSQAQYMVFTADSAAVYVSDTETPYARSSYTINEANQLLLPDISREYKVAQKTDNCVRLYESATTYMLLVRNAQDACAATPVTAEALSGKWNVTMKGDLMNGGEALEFSGDTLNYYKAGAADPITTTYAISDAGVLTAESLGLTMYCCASKDAMVFVEQGGIVWELKK